MIPATIRAGGWPPTLGWNPDLNLAYHHGFDLLVALLTPPTGPDLAFTTELLGACAWTALILLAATLLIRRGSWVGTLALMPLLLAPGAWTLVFGEQPMLLQLPVPTGVPSAGLRAAISDVYWPSVELPWSSEQQAVPPNIWKPQFSLAYAMGLCGAGKGRMRAPAPLDWRASTGRTHRVPRPSGRNGGSRRPCPLGCGPSPRLLESRANDVGTNGPPPSRKLGPCASCASTCRWRQCANGPANGKRRSRRDRG